MLGEAGSGTYGIVLKARCRKTGDLVAIKRFRLSEEKAPQVGVGRGAPAPPSPSSLYLAIPPRQPSNFEPVFIALEKISVGVALKWCACSWTFAQVRKTAQREEALLRSLAHPNIVALRAALRHEGRLALVFDYAPRTGERYGPTLAHVWVVST